MSTRRTVTYSLLGIAIAMAVTANFLPMGTSQYEGTPPNLAVALETETQSQMWGQRFILADDGGDVTEFRSWYGDLGAYCEGCAMGGLRTAPVLMVAGIVAAAATIFLLVAKPEEEEGRPWYATASGLGAVVLMATAVVVFTQSVDLNGPLPAQSTSWSIGLYLAWAAGAVVLVATTLAFIGARPAKEGSRSARIRLDRAERKAGRRIRRLHCPACASTVGIPLGVRPSCPQCGHGA